MFLGSGFTRLPPAGRLHRGPCTWTAFYEGRELILSTRSTETTSNQVDALNSRWADITNEVFKRREELEALHADYKEHSRLMDLCEGVTMKPG